MALEVRRIVTGHDTNGKAGVTTDERLAAVPRLNRPHISGVEIWSTDKMPADNSAAADAAQRAGFVKRYNYVGTGQGTVIRVTEFAPGAPKFMHRTETVDYAILLSGECDLEFDSGEIVDRPGTVDQLSITPARMVWRDHPIALGKQVEPRPLRHQPFAGVQKQQWPAGAALDQFEAGPADGERTRHHGAG